MDKQVFALDNVNGRLTIEYMPCVNFSMHHNHFPTLLKCVIANEGDSPWHEVNVNINGESFVRSTATIDSIAPSVSVDVSKLVAIEVNPSMLMQLSEGIDSRFTLDITSEGTQLFCRDFPLHLMAYDQWPGLSIRPELVAAFVTPNHSILSRVATKAASFLEKWTGNANLDEYQSQDPNRVRAQVAAIYEALRSECLVYATPPASYETSGQRIRTVEKVLTEKLGTCIDLSLLMASCLESIGINPILVLIKGHCFIGAWLVKDAYPKPVGDDPTFLTKCSAHGINEMVFLEATDITGSTAVDFESAVADGMAHLQDASSFICFIDVYRARVAGIRPLPLRIKDGDGWTIDNDGIRHDNATTEVRHVDRYDLTEYSGDGKTVSKFNIWERKLLDFSLRNNLLNIRMGRRIIPIVSFAVNRLEDAIQANISFRIDPFPLDEKAKLADSGIYNSQMYANLEDYIGKQLANKRVNSFLSADELTDAMKYLYRASRTSMEENGANNLYLVIGVLKWFETDKSTQPRFAPVLLVPIEMVRASGGGGYTIRVRDEETVPNITLVQLLLQQHDVDLTWLDDLPKDESGVDVPRIFAFIRDRIRYKHGWDLLEESMIGLFSFSKFVMWNDIHTNSQALLENDIISSLVDGRLNITDPEIDVDAKDADRKLSPDNLLIPIDVDSSQLEAVIASGAGKSFILHGPPGTGKSQTITNMIANALYQGKRVLFVAEKMAALEVVQDRLERIGLAPFCLELHSNKVTKQHFLHQMEEALAVVRTTPADVFAKEADAIFDKRLQLISYIEKLHADSKYGISLYNCIMAFMGIKGDAITVDLAAFPDIDMAKMQELAEEIAHLDTVFSVTGRPEESPLHDLDITDGSPEAEAMVADTSHSLTLTYPDRPDFLPVDTVHDSADYMRWETEYIEFILAQRCFSRGLINLAVDAVKYRAIADAVKAGADADTLRRSLANDYTDAVFDIDIDDLHRKWCEINEKWAVSKFFGKRSLLKQLGQYRPGFSDADVAQVISSRRRLATLTADYNKYLPFISEIFGDLAFPGNEQWSAMLSAVGNVHKLRGLLSAYASLTGVDIAEATARLSVCIPDNMDALIARSRSVLSAYISGARAFLETVGRFAAIARFNITGENWRELMRRAMSRWHDNAAMFRNWYMWCRERRKLDGMGLSPVVTFILANNSTGAEAAAAFSKGMYRAMAVSLINDDDSLRFFNGKLLDETIQKYREATARFRKLSEKELFCRLAAGIPSQQMAAHDSSEIGILKRNIRNGGRGTSIRKIIDQIPTLLPKLAPCMLMSPISVAQYIDLKNEKFDLVIFDEASQMPTSEAVGAIARGRALVVVGDPRQMPPTSFFATSNVGEDEAWIDDMESILDDCISLSVPSKHLLWHYRSRHESLISFSNAQYYDGKLFTFPSVDDSVSKVTMRFVGGVYDKGRTRSNIIEAQAVVDEVIRRLSDPVLRHRSIGIVSFSKVQQDKIEDLLTDALAMNPDLEVLAYTGTEPIFVKNLENVQGDERDIILFSVGYGPDKEGRVSMNFGPLNNVGGERRLNVAVSRARYEMVVFSSMTSEQIDLRRSNAPGVVGLKHFLEFAESGNRMIPASQAEADGENHMVEQLADFLHAHGYETRSSVGRSKFRVDLAVVHPDRKDEFLLGILCDGPGYYATKTVRDREIVQPGVLAGLKWNVMRVWTLDWFERREAVKQAVLSRLEELRNAPAVDAGPQPQPASPETADTDDGMRDEFKGAEPYRPVTVDDTAHISQSPATDYTFTDLGSSPALPNADALTNHLQKLRKQIAAIIETEQPVTDGLLYKRIVRHWGLNRVSPRLQGIVDSLLTSMLVHITDNAGSGRVLWSSAGSSEAFSGFRVNSDRDITEIPFVEVENAMLYTISQQLAIAADDLRRLTAQLLGFTRMGSNIDSITTKALASLSSRGLIEVRDGKAIKSIR